MSDCKLAFLPGRGVLRVGGSEARHFLQGLITNDMEHVSGTNAIHAALLTPQGKILFDFFVVADGDGLLLELSKEQIPALAKRLTFYKLRADVTFEDLSETHLVAALWGSPCPQLASGVCFADPRLADLGARIILDRETAPPESDEVSEDDYHAYRINLGVPEGGLDYEFEAAFPHEANFDLLGGVDFKKGCYVGQEVVSRMEHRGTARKRIIRVEAMGGVLVSGAEISADGNPLGKIGSVCGASGLALLRLDRAKAALDEGNAIIAGDVAIRLISPAYADFELPE